MAKQLTAPGCIYTIVARVDTTIYSPDQNWVLDVPAGQHDFIAETNEVIIPADAMMRRKTRQHAKDRNRINLLGIGPGSLVSFITRAIERIVGKGNVTVTYEDGKMTVVLAASATLAQIAMVESLLDRMLPKDVTEEISDAPIGYTRLYFLESTGVQWIDTRVKLSDESEVTCEFSGQDVSRNSKLYGADNFGGAPMFRLYAPVSGNLVFYNGGTKMVAWGSTKMEANVLYSVVHNNEVVLRNGVKSTNPDPETNWETLYTSALFGCRGEQQNAQIHNGARVYSFSISRNSRLQLNFVPTLDPAGKPCMFDAVTRKPFYNAEPAGADFIAGMTTTQALNLANLPITGDGALTVSLPWEDQWDTGVQNALGTASTNGWTITVQYRDPDVGTENIPISFLESTGTQYLPSIEYPASSNLDFEMDCQFTQATNRRLIGADSVGCYWGIQEGRWEKALSFSDTPPIFGRYTHKLTTTNGDGTLQIGTKLWGIRQASEGSSSFDFNIANPPIYKVFSVVMNTDGVSRFNLIPILDSTGRPCMFDLITRKPFYNAATTGPDFIAGMTWEQVRKLQLPTTGGQLTLSLPYEASIDGIAQTALDQARANGWELILQYDEAKVPEGYSKLDFLEGTGVQWLDTGIKLSNESEVTCSYYVAENVQGNGYLFGASAPSETSDGIHFKYLAASEARPERVYAFMGHSQGSALPRPDGLALVTLNSATFKCNEKSLSFKDIPSFETKGSCVIYRTRTPSGSVENWGAITNARIYSFNISRSNSLQLAYIPCLDQAGVPCMFDLVSHQSFYNKGAGQFTAGMTWEQARKLHLPSPGGKLTLALPFEASIDSLTQAVLEQARANGWELTLQYDEVEVPAGYSKLDFLASTGEQWMVIPFENNGAVTTTVEMQWTDISGRQLLGYNSNSLYFGVNDQREGGWDISGSWNNYSPLDRHQFAFFVNADGANGYVYLDGGNALTRVNDNRIPPEQFYLWSVVSGSYKCMARVFSCYIVTEAGLVRNLVPCLAPDGTTCMYDTVTQQPLRNSGTGQFTAGMTLEQVRDLSLPAGGGQLTLALPYEASLDGLAQDALERARTNGWVLTLQYDEAVVPAGYSKLEYLQSRPRQNIMITDYVPDNETGIFVSAALDSAIQDTSANTVLIGCRTDLQTDSRFMAPRIVQYPSTGTQGYGWGTWRVRAYNYRTGVIKYESSINWLNNRRALLTFENEEPSINDNLSALSFTPTVPLALFGLNLKDSRELGSARRIYVAKFSQGDRIVREFIPCLDAEGVPCMYDLATKQSFRNSGSWQFIAGMTLEQVRGLSLPAGGGKLTLALPFEASIDKLAQTALEQARENGWELTLQYAESDVPAGYRKLDFLESTGTQYIDTGVQLSSESEAKCEYEFMLETPDSHQYIFDAQTILNDSFMQFGFVLYNYNAPSYVYGYVRTNTSRMIATQRPEGKTSIVLNKKGLIINDVFLQGTEPDEFILPLNCYLFADNHRGFVASKAYARVYSFSISRAGETQVDYVPCIAPDGKLGMYNKVDGTLQENAGTGAFIAGLATIDDVSNLWLPETGGELTISVPADTPDSAVDQLRTNNPTWQIAIQYRTDNEN